MAPIFDFSDDDMLWEHQVEEIFGLDADLINVRYSKNYIDAGHHHRPNDGYYWVDGTTYYYLEDYYSDEDVSGWYKYYDDQAVWRFYCDYEDKNSLGDVLYYYPESAFIGDSDASWRITGKKAPPSFHDTEWYKTFAAHQQEYRTNYD